MSVGLLALLVVALTLWIGTTAGNQPDQVPPPAVHPSISAEVVESIPEYSDVVPVLLYRDISDRGGGPAIPPSQFAEHMAALDQLGFQTVTLADVSAFLSGDAALPPRPILLTFDDGAASNWLVADPILEQYSYNAVEFLITGSVAVRAPSYYLTWQMVRAMRDSGRWEFGAHTHDLHRDVTTTSGAGPALINRLPMADGTPETLRDWQARVEDDLRLSFDVMKRELELRPLAFAYPVSASSYPTNDNRIPPMLSTILEDRYELLFTGEGGTEQLVASDTPWNALPRLSMDEDTTAESLLTRLSEVLPDPLPASMVDRRWDAAGNGKCDPAARELVISSATFVTCTPDLNGSRWSDYEVTARLRGVSRDATAIAAIRVGASGHGEIAVGESLARVRQYVDGSWQELSAFEISPPRSGVIRLSLRVVGQTLHVRVGTAVETVSLSPKLRRGGIHLGLAARGEQTLEFAYLEIEPLDRLATGR